MLRVQCMKEAVDANTWVTLEIRTEFINVWAMFITLNKTLGRIVCDVQLLGKFLNV